jgi:cysteine desulfurase
VPGAVETGDREARTPGHLHICFAGVESEALVILLDEAGVAVSAGSSCSSGATEPSHVLLAMGLDRAEATSGIRFSLGPTSTDNDVDRALAAVPDAVARLRA